jgi:hypothetical protein
MRAVYFVQAQALGLIKIGVAVDPKIRLGDLQCGSPDALAMLGVIWSEDAQGLEGSLHRRFRDHRRHGEWFAPVPALISYILENAAALGDEERVFLSALDLTSRPRRWKRAKRLTTHQRVEHHRQLRRAITSA